MNDNKTSPRGEAESLYACVRLGAALLLMTIGGAAMYGVVVALPALQAEFGVTRADASLPYTLTMVGFGVGGILMGRLSDRFGVILPVVIGALSLGAGFLLSGMSVTLWQFSLAHGLLAGLLGCAAAFAPLVPDTSMWFTRHRGLAVACCVAMSMPQVHIVAYCGDLGYGAARGAEMLALMLGFGIVSRLASGWICDRIGGLRTLLLGSALQGIALVLFLPFDALASLYIVSALFGLFQGGLVPSYAIIVREYFKPGEAGARLGVVLMVTLLGMAAGGWVSGAIFDLTGSYRAAFVNGIAWNLLNMTIAFWLLLRAQRANEMRPSWTA